MRAENLTNSSTRVCPSCGEKKDVKDFSGGYCKKCRTDYNTKYKRDRKGEHLKKIAKLVEMYGGCHKCGETDPTKLNVFPTYGKGQSFAARSAVKTDGTNEEIYLECKEECKKDELDHI